MNTRAFLALIVGAIGISFAPILVRWSELSPTSTALMRMLCALPFYGLAIAVSSGVATGPDSPHSSSDPPVGPLWSDSGLWLAASMFAGDLAAWHRSIEFTSVANATLLANFAPVLVTLGAWLWLGERVTSRFLVGLVAALLGAGLLVRGSAHAGPDPLYGDALGLLTAAFYAGYQLAVKRVRVRRGTLEVMVGVTAFSALVLGGLAWAEGKPVWPTTWTGWAVCVGLGFGPQFLGQGLIAYAFAHLSASFSSVSLLLQPAMATGLAWALLGEHLGGWQAFGGALILGGVMLARRGVEGPVDLKDAKVSSAG